MCVVACCRMWCSVRCSVLQCVAVCCGVLQCVAVCYSVLQCVAVWCDVPTRAFRECGWLYTYTCKGYIPYTYMWGVYLTRICGMRVALHIDFTHIRVRYIPKRALYLDKRKEPHSCPLKRRSPKHLQTSLMYLQKSLKYRETERVLKVCRGD